MSKYLVVVDMQNDFIDGSLGTPEAQAILPKVIEKIKNFKGAVVYTRDTHDEDYLETLEGKNLPVEHCIMGTEGWQLQKDIQETIDRICMQPLRIRQLRDPVTRPGHDAVSIDQ